MKALLKSILLPIFCSFLFTFEVKGIGGQQEELLKEFEIRVIRPQYFVKRNRFELGSNILAITNQTFIYTYLFSINLAYHLTDEYAFELLGSYGFSDSKIDKDIIEQDFNIKTQLSLTEYTVGGNFLWTPMYGKYQLQTGNLMYFDTFLSAGGGMLGVRHKFDHCGAIYGAREGSLVKNTPYFEMGLGQRYFISKNDSLRWDLKGQLFSLHSSDYACTDSTQGEYFFTQNIIIQMGYARFL